jgi:large subunit ribosomal protein L25
LIYHLAGNTKRKYDLLFGGKEMVEIKISAKPRMSQAGSHKHHLKQQGKIPAVIYGKGVLDEAIELEVRDLETAIRQKGRNALIDLVIKGRTGNNKHIVMIKEIQRDPISKEMIHADLYKISLKEKLQTQVPIRLKGEAKGQIKGGIVQSGLREIEVECIPAKIPETFQLDISALDIGDNYTVADLPGSPDYRILSDQDSVLVTVTAPRMAEPEPVKEETVTAPAAGKTSENSGQ